MNNSQVMMRMKKVRKAMKGLVATTGQSDDRASCNDKSNNINNRLRDSNDNV